MKLMLIGLVRNKMKALALLSGGLDSRLAIKLMSEQNVDVEVLHFKLPFENCSSQLKLTQFKDISLHIADVTKGRLFHEYIKIVRKPKHGYGSSMNPCIDCKIFMLKKAKQIAKRIGAKFIVTGEVVGERPMSQRRDALKLIEKESGLTGKILRPLSAKVLPETEAEKKGWVDRNKFLAIMGRGRRPQLDLAKKLGIKNFPTPAGGCLLCEKEFGVRVRDLFRYKKRIMPKDIELLKLGRHFRYKNNKIIVGRNELENKQILRLRYKTDHVFEVPDYGSPITILQGKKTKESIKIAARLTARYSDAKDKEDNILMKYGIKNPTKKIIVNAASQQEIDELRL